MTNRYSHYVMQTDSVIYLRQEANQSIFASKSHVYLTQSIRVIPMLFYKNEDIIFIIDPSYKDIASFRKDYDYDLVGNPITLRGSFLLNPIGYLHNIIQQYALELIFISLVLFGFFFVIVFLLHIIKKLVKYIRLIKLLLKEFSNVKSQFKKINEDNLPMNYDIYAKAIFTALISYYELFKGETNIIIPEDLVEYEIIRFVLEAAWGNSISSRQLHNVDLNQSIEDEPIEGLKADKKNVFCDDEWVETRQSDFNNISTGNVELMKSKGNEELSNDSTLQSSFGNEQQMLIRNDSLNNEGKTTSDYANTMKPEFDYSEYGNKNNIEMNTSCSKNIECLSHPKNFKNTSSSTSTVNDGLWTSNNDVFYEAISNWFSVYSPLSSDHSDIDEPGK
ncbi:unnamed protein product [Heterobilharzia americana]|nr:unnamed protein product [Heterobilharzia americana]